MNGTGYVLAFGCSQQQREHEQSYQPRQSCPPIHAAPCVKDLQNFYIITLQGIDKHVFSCIQQ